MNKTKLMLCSYRIVYCLGCGRCASICRSQVWQTGHFPKKLSYLLMSALGLTRATSLPCMAGAVGAQMNRRAIPSRPMSILYAWFICVLKPTHYFPYFCIFHFFFLEVDIVYFQIRYVM